MPRAKALEGYESLKSLIEHLDHYFEDRHNQFFSAQPTHPFLPVKRFKVIHDNLWGTNRFAWQELALIDSPIVQRLRDIHQTGLAFQVYPSARHTRFEHSLGVVTLSTKVFDALLIQSGSDIRNISNAVFPEEDIDRVIHRLRQELRLAALLHDTGHSLFSHASEKSYSRLSLIERASVELTALAGKKKGASEAIAFCLARTNAVARDSGGPKELDRNQGAVSEALLGTRYAASR